MHPCVVIKGWGRRRMSITIIAVTATNVTGLVAGSRFAACTQWTEIRLINRHIHCGFVIVSFPAASTVLQLLTHFSNLTEFPHGSLFLGSKLQIYVVGGESRFLATEEQLLELNLVSVHCRAVKDMIRVFIWFLLPAKPCLSMTLTVTLTFSLTSPFIYRFDVIDSTWGGLERRCALKMVK